jgi:Archaeal actin homologue MreB-like, C-terminal
MDNYENVTPVGVDLGTSTSKFCDGDRILYFSSVAGDALTDQLEEGWRRMNRSNDHRWAHNLALWDEARGGWRYLGAMTRSSLRPQWYTEGGVLQNFDDAYLALQAGLFLLGEEHEQPLARVALGFGVPIKAGEQASERFLDHVSQRLVTKDDRRLMKIRAKNVATGQVREEGVEVVFSLVQFQAYGAYMVLLFSKFGMKLFNSYIVDVGHGTWITLPVADNEADIALADSTARGMHTITSNISQALFEKSAQKVKIQEQRIMEKIAAGQREIEVPGAGVFNFGSMLDAECEALADDIMKKIRLDVAALGAKGVGVDYFAVVGGGANLVFAKLKRRISEFFGWDAEMANARIVGNEALPIEPRYANAVGLMLLARDQIAIDMGKDVDPSIQIRSLVSDRL